MACTSVLNEQINDLAAGSLDADQVEALLTHVDGCRLCSEQLDEAALVLASPGLAATARGPRRAPARTDGRDGRVAGRRPSRRSAGWLAAAASLIALFALTRLLTQPAGGLPGLADTTPVPFVTSMMRGDDSGPSEAWKAAIEAYGAADYARAASLLDQLATAGDERALLQLYLGIARLQLEQWERADAALALAAQASGLLRERALWYRGQARLALDDAAGARAIFAQLVELAGDYELNASAVLESLDERGAGE